VKSAELKAVENFGSPEIPLFPQKGLESNDFARGGEGSGKEERGRRELTIKPAVFSQHPGREKGKELPGRME